MTLPQQRGVSGHLRVRGASVVDRYFKAEAEALDEEGYFDTGDLASIDEDGNLTICGRSKDLIKSGGEWINPAEIEAIVGRDPAVSLVAVISRPDHKWGERPLLIVQPREGETHRCRRPDRFAARQGRGLVDPREIARVAAMPLAAPGKIDKHRLREDFAEGIILADETSVVIDQRPQAFAAAGIFGEASPTFQFHGTVLAARRRHTTSSLSAYIAGHDSRAGLRLLLEMHVGLTAFRRPAMPGAWRPAVRRSSRSSPNSRSSRPTGASRPPLAGTFGQSGGVLRIVPKT